MPFEPKRHLIKVQGGRMYLPVSARLIWFRLEHPDWGIETETIALDLERQYAIFRARIYDAEGKLMATGTKHEDVRGFPDYIEKSETGSVGRALALCGFGTQFAPELDEVDMRQAAAQGGIASGRFADSPQPARAAARPEPPRIALGRPVDQQSASNPSPPPASSPASETPGEKPVPACGNCRKALTRSQQELSIRHYGEALCPACQRDRARQSNPAPGGTQ